MCSTVLESPVLYGVGYDVSGRDVERLALLHCSSEVLVDVLRELVLHHGLVEDAAAE